MYNGIVVASVIHKKSINNLKKFSQSLVSQSYKKFNIIILNDGIKKPKKFFSDKLNIRFIDKDKSINLNRIKLIKKCITSGFKKIIFIDSDDYVDRKRVEVVSKLLKTNSIVVNDLNLVCKDDIVKKIWSKRLSNSFKISYQDIINSNFLGMTNTSVKSSIFKNFSFKYLKKAPVFDWALWIKLLKKNKGIFTNKTSTYYQNNSNGISSLHSIRKSALRNKKKTMKEHQIKFLKKNKIISKTYLIKNYLDFKNSSKKIPFWWEE